MVPMAGTASSAASTGQRWRHGEGAPKTSDMPMSASMPGLDVVARMSKRRPFGGRLVKSTRSACRTALEKRGPIGTQSAIMSTAR